MKNIFIVGFFLLFASYLQGQTISDKDVRAENVSMQVSKDDALHVEMNLILPEDMKLESNRAITFTPIIRKGNNEVLLAPVTVYGRKRYIVSKRNGLIPPDEDRVYRHTNNKEQVIHYAASISSQAWMDGADVILQKDICGCGNHSQEITYMPLTGIELPDKLPSILYLAPKPEVIKRRVLKGQAYIDFPLNETVIYPDFHRNAIELAKIDSTLRGFEISEIQSIALHGYASPEGTYKHNAFLAQGRTQALKDYIIRKFGISKSIIETNSTPEDWDGFIKLAEISQIKDRERILEIARKDIDPDAKEAELKRLTEAYQYIKTHWLPVLRHTDYEIEYHLPYYTPEEARKVVKDNPSQLSLREMYDAALLAGKGSEEYYQLIETAVLVYPDSPEANLNAAAASLERGNIEAAEKYMEKADMSTPEAKNNMKYINILKEKQ